jgi:hypothetical protein
MTFLAPARQLLRAKDLADSRYFEPLDVPTLARAARLSPAHFSREFRRVPPAAGRARVPTCVLLAWGRPAAVAAGKRGQAYDVQEPMEQPYGVDAGFRDISGNHIRMVQGNR